MTMKKLNYSNVFKWALGLAVLAATGISLYIGLKQSIWYDEAFSIMLSKFHFTDIVRMTSEDVHTPFYYWALKTWTLAFGSSEPAVRSLSAVCLGASVGMAGLLIKRVFGAKTALIALPFIVFAPFMLRYGFEVRMYALGSLVGITATYVLVAITETVNTRRRRILLGVYALLVALGVYTLYFMAFLWFAHLAWLAWFAYTKKRRSLFIEGLVAYAGSFLLFSPWLPAFISKADGHTMPAITHALGFDELLGILSFDFLYHPPWHLSLVNIAAIIFSVAAMIYLGVLGYKRATTKERPYVVLFVLYIGVPILLFFLIGLLKPIYVERYLSHVIIGGYALIGLSAGLALRSREKLRITIAVASVLGLILLFGCMQLAKTGNFIYERMQYPEIKQMAAHIDCKNGATIFAEGPYIAIELAYYVKDCPIYFYYKTATMGGGYVTLSGSPLRLGDPAKELDFAQKVLYVYYGDQEIKMPTDMHQTDDVVSFGPMHTATYVKNN